MKRIISIILAFVLLACLTTAVAATAGTASDPLATLSYIIGTFKPAVQSETDAAVDSGLLGVYTTALSGLENVYDNYVAHVANYKGYTFSDKYTALSLSGGDSITLPAGSSFIVESGSVTVEVLKGTVINISTGYSVSSGSTLTKAQRYFCVEDTIAVYSASSYSKCYIDGYYTNGDLPPMSFYDVSTSSWYYGAVEFVYKNELFKGTSSTSFSPDATMTRAMFVTVLYRLAGSPSVYGSSNFSDVTNSSIYYYAPVVWANANGIVTGYNNGTFEPDTSITREQMAVAMYRYAEYAGYDVSNYSDTAFNSFPDNGSVSSWAVTAIKWATYNGLINGSDGKLLPTDTAMRSQVAQIAWNFCNEIVGM